MKYKKAGYLGLTLQCPNKGCWPILHFKGKLVGTGVVVGCPGCNSLLTFNYLDMFKNSTKKKRKNK